MGLDDSKIEFNVNQPSLTGSYDGDDVMCGGKGVWIFFIFMAAASGRGGDNGMAATVTNGLIERGHNREEKNSHIKKESQRFGHDFSGLNW